MSVRDGADDSRPSKERDRSVRQDDHALSSSYAGASNLEAMEAARNYNAFLVSTVLRCADLTGPVLDFGAGTGTHSRKLRDRGAEVLCVEPDTQLRRELERDGFQVAPSVLDHGREVFASIYSINVLEHIEDDAAAVRDLFAVMAPGGSLILYVPAFQVLFSAMDRKVGHLRRYRKGELISLAQDAGFRVRTCRYVDSLGFIAALAYRWLGDTGELSAKIVGLYDRFVFPLSRVIDRITARWFGKNLLLVAHRE